MKRAVTLPILVVLAALILAFTLRGGLAPAPQVELLPDNAVDVAQELLGIPGKSVLLTVEGQKITAEEYLYWLGYLTSYYEGMYGAGVIDYETEVAPGMTWDAKLKEIACQNASMMALTPVMAKEYGVSLTAEDLAAVAEDHAQDIQEAGGAEYYAYELQARGINDSTAYDMAAASALISKFQDAYVEKTAAGLSAQEVAEFIQTEDVLRAKHILIAKGDTEDQAALADRRAQAEILLGQVLADPDSFDRLMNARSEDPGTAESPEGYLFTANQMVTEFEEAVRALEYGQIADHLVETSYGWHIILRLDPDCDALRQEMAAIQLESYIRDKVESAQVVTTPAYEAIRAQDYYSKLKAFQGSLAQPQVTDQSAAQLAPAE